MGDKNRFELTGRQGGLHILQEWAVPHRGADMGHPGTVAGQNITHPVAKIPGIDHQHLVAGLHQVGSSGIHGKRAGTGDDKGLTIRGKEHLAHPLQGLPKGLNKIGGNVACGWRAHCRQDRWFKFNRSGDHKKVAIFHPVPPKIGLMNRNGFGLWRQLENHFIQLSQDIGDIFQFNIRLGNLPGSIL